MAETRSQSKESQLDKLKETIDDKNAQIGERIHALLLLLRSRKAEEENLHVHACPTSSQLSDCDEDQIEHRTEKLVPEAQEQVVMNENLEQEWVHKTFDSFDVEGDVEKGHKMLSIEKFCCAHQVFAKMSPHKETLGIKKKQKGFKSWRFKFKHRVAPRDSKPSFEVKMKQKTSKEYPYKMLLEGRFEVPTSTDLLLSKERDSPPEVAIGCELEAGERDTWIDQNQLIQEEAKNHSTDSFHETSLLHHMTSLLKHQVSISYWKFSHRFPTESLDVYDDWPSAIMRTYQSQSNFDLEYAAINAYQVGDSRSLRTKLLTNGRRKTFLKTWRFKFKDTAQPRELMQEKLCVHEANDTMNQLMLPMHLGSHILHQQKKPSKSPKSWKFKFKSENLRKMEVNSVLDNREVVKGVVERIRQVTSVTKNFSTRQLFGKKLKDKGRLRWKKRRKALKSWRFKFKNRDLRGYKLSIVKLLLKNSLVVTGFWWWFMRVKRYKE